MISVHSTGCCTEQVAMCIKRERERERESSNTACETSDCIKHDTVRPVKSCK